MRSKYILIIIIAVLAIAVALLAVLNAGDPDLGQQSQDNATVTVVAGDINKTIGLEYLKTFDKVTFDAVMDTSTTGPEGVSLGGVPLAVVLQDMGISLEGAEQVVFKAADGYTTVVTASEAGDSDNVYLVYEREGQPLGTMRQGGHGPIEVAVRKDEFAQRWCKYLMEIHIE